MILRQKIIFRGHRVRRRGMNKFELLKAISIENIANMILELAKAFPEEKMLTEQLKREFTEEELQAIQQVAQSGNYPLSFSGKQ